MPPSNPKADQIQQCDDRLKGCMVVKVLINTRTHFVCRFLTVCLLPPFPTSSYAENMYK